MRNDRLSMMEQHELSYEDAVRNEMEHGLHSLEHVVEG